MLRITPYVLSARTILNRRSSLELQLVNFTRSIPNLKYKDPTERITCPPPPPLPPPPPKDDRLFWGTMALVVLAGGFAVYAKQSPELRDWLTLNAPWFDDIVAVLHQENMTYGEFAEHCIDNVKDFVNCLFEDTKPKQCSIEGKPVDSKPPPKDADCEDEQACVCEELPVPIVTKDVCEVEVCLKELSEKAYANLMTARDACSNYNKLVSETMNDFSFARLKELEPARVERIKIVEDALKKANTAVSQLDKLGGYIDCGVKTSEQALENTKTLLRDQKDKIKTMQIQFEWENDTSTVRDSQWQKVEATVDKYTTENKSLYPGLEYNTAKPQISQNADFLLYHTLRYKNKLQAELNQTVDAMTERVNRGIATLPGDEKEAKARNDSLQAAFKKRLGDLEMEYQKRYADKKTANDNNLKDSVKRQNDRHEETMERRLQQKEDELMAKMDKLVGDAVEVEKRVFVQQLSDMAHKLKIVEDKLNVRLKAERETRRSQELYAAGVSLLAATKRGDSVVNVKKELTAIEKASGDGDELVTTVLKAIPEKVREQGVVPESVLREKYQAMERSALRVALVEEDGAPLPIFFLSWLQSVLLFIKISGIPQSEIDKPPKEPIKHLDTFDLLQRSRYWMERGNIAAALRYVSSLQGASKLAAAPWYEAARSYVETRQAAEAVLAHAAALGLQYI